MSIRKNALLKLSTVLAAGSFMLGAAPALTHAAQLNPAQPTSQVAAVASPTWHPARPQAGMGSIVWTNFMGGGDELDVDMGGQIYKIAPETNAIPIRLQTTLAPGTYTFTASIADVSTVNRTVEVKAGQVIALGFYGKPETDTTSLPGGGDHGQDHNNAAPGREHNTDHNLVQKGLQYTDLLMAQEDLTAQAR